MQREYIAKYFFNGTAATSVIRLNETATHFVIFNDGTVDLTFTIGADTSILKAGDSFDERVNPFNTYSIAVTNGSFHGYVRTPEGGVG